MAIDTVKIFETEEWIDLSAAIHLLAFDEARDCDAMERAGYPSARRHGAEIDRLLKRCRKEANTDPSYSAFLDVFRNGVKWIAVYRKGITPPGMRRKGIRWFGGRPVSSLLRACKTPWPPSGMDLYDVITRYEWELAEEDQKIVEAEVAILNALLSGKVPFNGQRDGRQENLDKRLFAGAPEITWQCAVIEAPSRKDGMHHGRTLEWTGVHVHSESLMEWNRRRQQAEKAEAVVAASRAPTANQTKPQKRRGPPITYTKDERLVQDVLAILEDSPPRLSRLQLQGCQQRPTATPSETRCSARPTRHPLTG